MNIITIVSRLSLVFASAALAAALMPAVAQTTGYAIGEPSGAKAGNAPSSGPPDSATAGPVRLARFSFVQGGVTWRADDSLDWSAATINQPMKQGAQIAVAAGGRAEIQFDDGGYFRLGGGSIAALQLLFSDAEGEFTEIKLVNGIAILRLKHNRSVYQLDTPLVSIKADGPLRLRVGISDGVEVALREGAAVVEGAKGKVTMNVGDYLDLRDETSPYDLHGLPAADSWERWNDDRDQMLDAAAQSLERRQVPPDVALVAGNLDAYGTWRNDTAYGLVWCPRTIDASWRPYYAGHWVWVNPFGWTWCSDEPWGWAPYHYGAWFHAIYGWAWRPGPANQFWSPAVVHFTECNGNIAWCALAPAEIQYPAAFSVGVFGAAWPGYFSIAAVGCYYPIGANLCVGRAFSTVYVNGGGAAKGSAAFAANSNIFSSGKPFVPTNAKAAAGVTVSTQAGFAGRGPYTALISGSTTVFAQGRMVAAPAVGRAPIFGPLGVKPSVAALTSTRAYVRPPVDISAAAARPVFSSPVPKEPVHTGVIVARNPGGATGAGGGIVSGGASTSGSNNGASGRTSGSSSDAASAARAALNRGGSPSGNSSGGTTPGSPNAGGGYVVGRSTGGSTGGAPPGSGSGGGSNSGAGSTAGHTSGGSTSGGSTTGGGYHVGGGTPAGGSPVRR